MRVGLYERNAERLHQTKFAVGKLTHIPPKVTNFHKMEVKSAFLSLELKVSGGRKKTWKLVQNVYFSHVRASPSLKMAAIDLEKSF